MSITIRVQYDHLDAVRDAMLQAAAKTIPQIAQTIAEDASYNAPVDTGSEESGFYIVTADQDTYEQAAAAAQMANPRVVILPHIDEQADATHGYVSHAPEHTIYQELGTAHMAPQPALIPAAEAHRQDYEDLLTANIQEALDGILGR